METTSGTKAKSWACEGEGGPNAFSGCSEGAWHVPGCVGPFGASSLPICLPSFIATSPPTSLPSHPSCAYFLPPRPPRVPVNPSTDCLTLQPGGRDLIGFEAVDVEVTESGG